MFNKNRCSIFTTQSKKKILVWCLINFLNTRHQQTFFLIHKNKAFSVQTYSIIHEIEKLNAESFVWFKSYHMNLGPRLLRLCSLFPRNPPTILKTVFDVTHCCWRNTCFCDKKSRYRVKWNYITFYIPILWDMKTPEVAKTKLIKRKLDYLLTWYKRTQND